MTIHLYATCWNEMRIIDFFFRHYEGLVDRFVMFDDGSTDGTLDYLHAKANVEVRPFPRTDPGSFVLSQQVLQNNCWKESRGAADWVIVTAIDEHIHHPALSTYLAACKASGVTYIPALGFQMVTNDFPRPDEHLARTRTWGAPDGEYSKLRIFDPDAITESNFAVGGHRSGVEGRCVLPARDELLLLHYRELGVSYMRERDPALNERLGPTDKLRTFGSQYSYTDEERARVRAERMAKAVNISGPFYCPWRDHREPRWWRDSEGPSANGR
jgi:Glycosyl transferase family 2